METITSSIKKINEQTPGYRELNLNRIQMLMMFFYNSNKLTSSTFIGGRGTGKSYMIAYLIWTIIHYMPRSSWAIQTATFQQALTRTLISTCEALEAIGYRRNVTYWIGVRPPLKYTLPFQAPAKFDRYITFLNPDGITLTGFHLFSQDVSARGPSVDGIITDEALELNFEKFYMEASATNRGNDDYKLYTDCSLNHGIYHFSSMPSGDNAENLLKDSLYYEEDNYLFEPIKNKVIDLELEFLKETDKKMQLEIYKAILAGKSELIFYPNKSKDAKKRGKLYIESDVFDNIENVGIKYIFDQYEVMLPEMFEVEMLNRKKTKTINCFYAGYNETIHGYKGDWNYDYLQGLDFDFSKLKKLDCRQDKDLVPGVPLDIGMDFGNINWLIACQKLTKLNRFNIIKEFYVRTPKILDDIINDFANYYQYHDFKKVRLWPDAAGNIRLQVKTSSGANNNVQHVCDLLRAKGWQVEIMNANTKNWSHNDKFLLWNSTFARRDKSLPIIAINSVNCPNLIISMLGTPAKDDGKNGVEKDKSSEKNWAKSLKRIHATDSTDAVDQVFFGNYKHLLPNARGNKPLYFASIFGQ